MIEDVPPQHSFWLLNGKTVKNIAELARELKTMSLETFAHHVSEQKNDFANWVEHCVKDHKLAALMRTTRNQERMKAIIERKIQETTRPRQIKFGWALKTEFSKPPEIKKPTIPKPETPEPSIVRTKSVTLLNLAHHEKPEEIIQPQEQSEIIHTPHKTELKLHTGHPHREIYIHEVNKKHHSLTLLISHIIFGAVIGVSLAAIIMMYNM